MESREWPPEGYSDPEPIEEFEVRSLFIGALIGLCLLSVFQAELRTLSRPIEVVLPFTANLIGIPDSTLTYIALSLVLVAGFIVLLGYIFKKTVIPVHEWLHYIVGEHMNLRPKYIRSEFLFVKNPAALPMRIGSTRRQHIPASLAPLLVIGCVSLVAIVAFDGVTAGLASFVLVVNSAASGKDIHNVVYLLSMPSDARYASFLDEDGENWTEYALPDSVE